MSEKSKHHHRESGSKSGDSKSGGGGGGKLSEKRSEPVPVKKVKEERKEKVGWKVIRLPAFKHGMHLPIVNFTICHNPHLPIILNLLILLRNPSRLPWPRCWPTSRTMTNWKVIKSPLTCRYWFYWMPYFRKYLSTFVLLDLSMHSTRVWLIVLSIKLGTCQCLWDHSECDGEDQKDQGQRKTFRLVILLSYIFLLLLPIWYLLSFCKTSPPSIAESISDLRSEAAQQFITLKRLNRVGHLRVQKARDATAEKKGKVDNYHLKLQNLLYEVIHLQKEINKCLEFKSEDEEINLVSVDEFEVREEMIGMPFSDNLHIRCCRAWL